MNWLKRFFRSTATPVVAPVPDPRQPMRISDAALAEASMVYGKPINPWVVPDPAPGIAPKLAMDSAPGQVGSIYNWAMSGAFSEGLGFLGYPYLAELSQRPEYRRISEIIAEAMTRKWIKLSGDEERCNKLEDAIRRYGVREAFREAAEQDGLFGRSHIYLDFGTTDRPDELATPLALKPEKIAKGSLKSIKVVEPFWCYPGMYESTNPLKPDFYKPRDWYVMGAVVHHTRLLTFVGREMPDILKPAYQFGGLSLSQMAKPYIDNWIRTRQSVSDLLHAFSVMVLKTDMNTVLAGGAAQSLLNRLQMFTQTRDNRGVMAINNETEDFANISAPLGTLDALQAQSQEQMASVSGIPLVELLGITPSGLNASSEGELKSYYGRIKADQESLFRRPLHTLLSVLQLNEFGDIDDTITFEFLDLWEMDDEAKARIRKSDGDADVGYVNAGIVSPEEVRERLAEDEQGLYFGVDLSAPPPEPPAGPSDEEEYARLKDAAE